MPIQMNHIESINNNTQRSQPGFLSDMKFLILTLTGILVLQTSNANVGFAKFLFANDICSTTTGWIRGSYSCLCHEGALVGCMNNTNCSYVSSCRPIPSCTNDQFLSCNNQSLCLQGLNCTSGRHCRVMTFCQSVLTQRKVCIPRSGSKNFTVSSNQKPSQPQSFAYQKFTSLQADGNLANSTDNATAKTQISGDTMRPTIEATAAPETAISNTTESATSAPESISNNTTAKVTAAPSANATTAPERETVQNESQNGNATGPAMTCWIETFPAIGCRNITQCYPTYQCVFQPKCINISRCIQNGTCQDSSTCRPVWQCG